MEEYPNENDAFALQYESELEVMNEMLLHEDNAGLDTVEKMLSSSCTVPNSPQTSEISFNSDTSQIGSTQRRLLFGTPVQSKSRSASTPLNRKLKPIKEVINELNESEVIEEMCTSTNKNNNTASDELRQLSKKRRLVDRDLYGDIDNMYNIDGITFMDPEAKKAKTEEEKDLEAIEKILAARHQPTKQNKILYKDILQRAQALREFKLKNLSKTVPQWPFLTLRNSNDACIFVRFHSEEYETNAINAINVANYNTHTLLGDDKQTIWQKANDLVLKKLIYQDVPERETNLASEYKEDSILWVEKYKPHKYIDLLSDEMTNRSLLHWIKMWDKVVFGKEFKALKSNVKDNSQLNTFNKRTGHFEINGGWYSRKFRQSSNTNVDEYGRPIQKIALLCGPPGLGKTTLANVIARHAGYNIREVNASDDRNLETFKMILENATQISAVMNEGRRPNCLILDEIDGAPRQSIEYLVKYVNDVGVTKKTKSNSTSMKNKRNILKRPIICICNDMYDAALRPLRQIALIINVPPIEASRLAERLQQIAKCERLKTDFGTLIALAEKSACDVRSCLSTMQFFSAQNKPLTLADVLNSNLGQKDRRHGLFDIWNSIFQIKRPKKELYEESNDNAVQVEITNMSLQTRAKHILNVIHSAGDYERLIQGIYENFLNQKMPDADFNGIVEALQWFLYADILQEQIQHLQNYALYPYLQHSFVKWHFLFASFAWPKIQFPLKNIEFHQKRSVQVNTLLALRKSMNITIVGLGRGCTLLLDAVSLIKRILSPQFRSMAIQLLSVKEQLDIRHTIDIMVDLGLTYVKLKSSEGSYICHMEPDLNVLLQFPDFPGITLTYFNQQLIAREVELKKLQLSMPKIKPKELGSSSTTSIARPAKPINHRLKAKKTEETTKSKHLEQEMISKDFFGRIQRKPNTKSLMQESSDPIVKSPIWYRYKEGFNNAVRKDITINDLL